MKRNPYPSQQGFSLVELMVGLTIGLFVLMGVLLIYSRWDGMSRTSSGKADAQMGSTVAGYLLDTDLRSAGLGLASALAPDPPPPASPSALGCVVDAYDSARSVPAFTFPLMPVGIVQGAMGAPDTINVLYGNPDIRTLHIPLTGSPSAFQKAFKERGGMMPGDKVVLVSDAATPTCAMVEVTAGPGYAVAKTIEHAQGGTYTNFHTGVSTTATMNPVGGTTIGSAGGGWAFNLGNDPQYNSWTVAPPPASPALTVTRLFGKNIGVATTVAEDVVNLQAQYGIDTALTVGARTGVVGLWADAPPADLTAVVAIRYALLVRNRQYEPPLSYAPTTWVTNNAPTWANAIPFVMTDVSGSGMGVVDSDHPDATNWRGYRYTVREGIIPLRNMLWGQR